MNRDPVAEKLAARYQSLGQAYYEASQVAQEKLAIAQAVISVADRDYLAWTLRDLQKRGLEPLRLKELVIQGQRQSAACYAIARQVLGVLLQ